MCVHIFIYYYEYEYYHIRMATRAMRVGLSILTNHYYYYRAWHFNL